MLMAKRNAGAEPSDPPNETAVGRPGWPKPLTVWPVWSAEQAKLVGSAARPEANWSSKAHKALIAPAFSL
jgi:hypothetical protein